MRSEGESSPVVRERGGETANIIIRQEDNGRYVGEGEKMREERRERKAEQKC